MANTDTVMGMRVDPSTVSERLALVVIDMQNKFARETKGLGRSI